MEIANPRKPPPVLEVTIGANYKVEEVMKDLLDYINISGHGYKKSLMSVLRRNHFTNLIRDGNGWIQYDGMRSRTRSLKPQFRPAYPADYARGGIVSSVSYFHTSE
jgi:hypothetical protein